MTNVESMDYMHSHPSTFASLSSTTKLSPVHYTHHIPSSKQPPYLPIMEFPYPFRDILPCNFHHSIYYDTHHHCHIVLICMRHSYRVIFFVLASSCNS